MNAIAVKEFRQAVRNNLVGAILTIFLALNLTVVGGYLLASPDAATSATGGRKYSRFLWPFCSQPAWASCRSILPFVSRSSGATRAWNCCS